MSLRAPQISSDVEGYTFTGESWYYATKSGNRILYPSAYARSGWQNMVYVHSTRKKVFGQGTVEAIEAIRSIVLGLRRSAQHCFKNR